MQSRTSSSISTSVFSRALIDYKYTIIKLVVLILNLLKSSIQEQDTAIIVTHKPSLLTIVDKIIVVNNGQIAMYGPKNEILSKLNQTRQN